MSKHTPGSWFTSNEFVRTENHLIAQIQQIRRGQTDFFTETEANARLIAAAPALLEAAKELNETICKANQVVPNTVLCDLQALRRAIDKAEGKE
jgi:hypothetical protein